MNRVQMRWCSVAMMFLLPLYPLQGWGQTARKNPVNKTLAQHVEQAANSQEQTLLDNLNNAFEYDDIIKALYRAHDFYNTQNSQNMRLAEPQYQPALDKTMVAESTRTRNLNTTVKPKGTKNPVLSAIAHNSLTPEALLDYLSPLSPKNENWDNTFYATLALNNTLLNTEEKYDGLEHFLRHAQMRILYRLSQATPVEERTMPEQTTLGQLRINMLLIHKTYQRLYGADPLDSYQATFPFPRQLDEVVVTAPRVQDRPLAGHVNPQGTWKGGPSNMPGIYAQMRKKFQKERMYFKDQLPSDFYAPETVLKTLAARKITPQFQPGKAALHMAGDFFLINGFVQLFQTAGELMGVTDSSKVIANLSAAAASEAEYELLEGNLGNLRNLIRQMESEKLADGPDGAVFKTDGVYQVTQPAMMNIFNTIYMYAVAPGRSQAQFDNIMNLLVEMSNPHEHSIMTRLAAISVSAKILNDRQDAQNPLKNANNAHLKQYKIGHEHGKQLGKPGAIDLRNASAGRMYHFADTMAQRIVDMYDGLNKNSHLSGFEDYDLDANQMRALSDELARLYNIFAKETSAKFPPIMSSSQEHMEQVVARNKNGIMETQIHQYGARVKNSKGQWVEMHMSNQINTSKYEADFRDAALRLAIDVISWKALCTVIKAGASGLNTVLRLTLPNYRAAQTAAKAAATKAAADEAARIAASNVKGAMAFEKPASFTLAEAFQPGVQATAQESKKVRFVMNHPVPKVSSRQAALQWMGLPEDATPKQIQAAYRKLSRQYHPDLLPSSLTEPAENYAKAQFQKLTQINEALKGKGKFPGAGSSTAAEPASNLLLPGRTVDDKFDPQSWAGLTQFFVKFYAVDKAMSVANAMAIHPQGKLEDETKAAVSKYSPDKYGDKSGLLEKSSKETSPLQVFDELNMHRGPQMEGGIVLLPTTLMRAYITPSDPLSEGDKMNMEMGVKNAQFTHAQLAGNAAQFKQGIESAIEASAQIRGVISTNYSDFLAAVPGAQRKLHTIYQSYQNGLRQAQEQVSTDMQKANDLFSKAEERLINDQANLLTQCVHAFFKQTAPQQITVYQQSLLQAYGELVSKADLDKAAQILTRYYAESDRLWTAYVSAGQTALKTGQDAQQLQEQAMAAWERVNQQKDNALMNLQTPLNQAAEKMYSQNAWLTTSVEQSNQLLEDRKEMYPADIAKYPAIQEELDNIFDQYEQQSAALLYQAFSENQDKDLNQTLAAIDNFYAQVQALKAVRDEQYAALVKRVTDQGSDLFIRQEQPASPVSYDTPWAAYAQPVESVSPQISYGDDSEYQSVQ